MNAEFPSKTLLEDMDPEELKAIIDVSVDWRRHMDSLPFYSKFLDPERWVSLNMGDRYAYWTEVKGGQYGRYIKFDGTPEESIEVSVSKCPLRSDPAKWTLVRSLFYPPGEVAKAVSSIKVDIEAGKLVNESMDPEELQAILYGEPSPWGIGNFVEISANQEWEWQINPWWKITVTRDCARSDSHCQAYRIILWKSISDRMWTGTFVTYSSRDGVSNQVIRLISARRNSIHSMGESRWDPVEVEAIARSAFPEKNLEVKRKKGHDRRWLMVTKDGAVAGEFKEANYTPGTYMYVHLEPKFFDTGRAFLEGPNYFSSVKDLLSHAEKYFQRVQPVKEDFDPEEVERIAQQPYDWCVLRDTIKIGDEFSILVGWGHGSFVVHVTVSGFWAYQLPTPRSWSRTRNYEYVDKSAPNVEGVVVEGSTYSGHLKWEELQQGIEDAKPYLKDEEVDESIDPEELAALVDPMGDWHSVLHSHGFTLINHVSAPYRAEPKIALWNKTWRDGENLSVEAQIQVGVFWKGSIRAESAYCMSAWFLVPTRYFYQIFYDAAGLDSFLTDLDKFVASREWDTVPPTDLNDIHAFHARYGQMCKGRELDPKKTQERLAVPREPDLSAVVPHQSQQFTSAKTCLKQVPALHKWLIKDSRVTPGMKVLDLGGGKYDLATEALARCGVTLLVYDPFNRSVQHNQVVQEQVKGGKMDVVICSNTLNVIKERQNRLQVIARGAGALKEGGSAYFSVYNAPRGKGRSGKGSWQEGRPIQTYLPEIKKLFEDVQVVKGFAVATKPVQDQVVLYEHNFDPDEIEALATSVIGPQPETDREGTVRWFWRGLLHREDGPAVEWADGGKMWYRNGQCHREDGPACEWVSGDKSWWRNGERHRDDGPAIEYANGDKEWYQNGKLHREDGPAVEGADGHKAWYRNGVKVKPFTESMDPDELEALATSVIGPQPETDREGTVRWFWRGLLHRDDGPAIEYADGTKEWWRNGQRHREDGPAIEWANGTKEWWRNGQRHRDDGPALEWADGYKEWLRNGQRHRDDGPAVEWADGSKVWWVNGVRVEPFTESMDPDELEALATSVLGPQPETDRDGTVHWYWRGQLHREDGPAVEWADGSKVWYRNGQCHREDGPAVEYTSGSKAWYRNGLRHRDDGPAVEWADGSKSWYRNGLLHRDDGPAIEYASGKKEWWRDGEEIE